MKIQRKFNWHRVTLVASCTAIVYAIAVALGAQTPTFSITLTGQSMIRSDARFHTPDIVARTAPLLKGDVIFTNFEATVIEKGQSTRDGRFLSPPEALDALKALGFNLLALSDNHSFDLKVAGIRNTLREVQSRNLAYAGTGDNLQEATAPGYLRTPKGPIALVAMTTGGLAQEMDS